MSFVHLHVHSEYSLLDGFSNIKKLVARAKEMGMPALALTDHGTMFGVIDFFNAAKKAGIKPIIGMEAYLAPRGMDSRDPQADKKSTHLLLLAENQTGYQNSTEIGQPGAVRGVLLLSAGRPRAGGGTRRRFDLHHGVHVGRSAALIGGWERRRSTPAAGLVL